jgi:hypothetical protein
MKVLKASLIFFLTVAIFTLGYQISLIKKHDPLKNELAESKKEVLKLKQIQKKLQSGMGSIVNRDLDHYLDEKDDRQRLAKAEQLLSQVFSLFLANIAFNISNKQKQWIDQPNMEKKGQTEPQEFYDGPEVIIDPYGERERQYKKEIEDLKSQLSAKKTSKKVKGKAYTQFWDKFNGPSHVYMDYDVQKQQWLSKLPIAGNRLKDIPKRYLTPYIGQFSGLLRMDNREFPLKVVIEEPRDIAKNVFESKLVMRTIGHPFLIEADFFLMHPRSHSNSGNGFCRAVVFNKEKNLQIHFIRLNNKKEILGRIFDLSRAKFQSAGSFYLNPVNSSANYDYFGRF